MIDTSMTYFIISVIETIFILKDLLMIFFIRMEVDSTRLDSYCKATSVQHSNPLISILFSRTLTNNKPHLKPKIKLKSSSPISLFPSQPPAPPPPLDQSKDRHVMNPSSCFLSFLLSCLLACP
ncbi:hypothetical protein DL98DRAFT_192127 [Cadophora sp. DSE1049]|nr:hypothetical protein DL98DRAFT_192127 [Cadophora sp. DSE1049]